MGCGLSRRRYYDTTYVPTAYAAHAQQVMCPHCQIVVTIPAGTQAARCFRCQQLVGFAQPQYVQQHQQPVYVQQGYGGGYGGGGGGGSMLLAGGAGLLGGMMLGGMMDGGDGGFGDGGFGGFD